MQFKVRVCCWSVGVQVQVNLDQVQLKVQSARPHGPVHYWSIVTVLVH